MRMRPVHSPPLAAYGHVRALDGNPDTRGIARLGRRPARGVHCCRRNVALVPEREGVRVGRPAGDGSVGRVAAVRGQHDRPARAALGRHVGRTPRRVPAREFQAGGVLAGTFLVGGGGEFHPARPHVHAPADRRAVGRNLFRRRIRRHVPGADRCGQQNDQGDGRGQRVYQPGFDACGRHKNPR